MSTVTTITFTGRPCTGAKVNQWLGGIRRVIALFRKSPRVKTPTILQMEATECGAVALGIVLAHFGRFVSLEELRIACGVSRDGTNAGKLVKAARVFGLTVRAFSMEPTLLTSLKRPLIVFWNFNHFVVVERFYRLGTGSGKVYLNDPATGPRVVTEAEFDRSFTGVVIELFPGPGFQQAGSGHTLIKSLARRLKSSRVAVSFIALVSLLLVVPGMVIPAFSRMLVDDVVGKDMRDWLGPLLWGMAFSGLARAVLTWAQQRFLSRLETKLALTESARFLWKLIHLPSSFFSQRHPGELASRVSSNDRVAQLLSHQVATNLFNLVTVVFFAGLLFTYDEGLALCAVICGGLNILALWYISRKRSDANRLLVRAREKTLGTAMSGLQSIDHIKATGTESELFRRWTGHLATLLNVEQSAGIYSRVLSVLPPLLASLGDIAVMLLGGLRIMDGRMTLGAMIAFQSLVGFMLDPLTELVNVGGAIQEADGYLARLDDVMQSDANRPLRAQAADTLISIPDFKASSGRLKGELEINNLSFSYNPLALPLVDRFTLSLRPGGWVALVGGTGSGKSTVARLVMGLYQPSSGHIRFDGVPLQHISQGVFRHSVALVDQEIVLFRGTVRENLSLWDPSIRQDDLEQAARDACIDEEIFSRPGGLDAAVSEGGVNFSAGQRQRLELARALARNPSLLILDEATSAMDPVIETAIGKNLRRRGCSCLIIAHRLSTIRDADEIVLMDRGQVIQRGSHHELVKQDGPYAELLKSDWNTSRVNH